MSGSHADWDRPLVFRIDGFSADGKRAFVFISEGSRNRFLEADEIDVTTGSVLRTEAANGVFLDKLGGCAASLRISGTGSEPGIPTRLASGAVIESLDSGAPVRLLTD